MTIDYRIILQNLGFVATLRALRGKKAIQYKDVQRAWQEDAELPDESFFASAWQDYRDDLTERRDFQVELLADLNEFTDEDLKSFFQRFRSVDIDILDEILSNNTLKDKIKDKQPKKGQ